MPKDVTYIKNGKVEKTKAAECHPLKLAPAVENIKKEWYDVITEVFNYQKYRESELHEIHKLFLDDRIDSGWKLYKAGNITDLVRTDVDIHAKVRSEEGDGEYTVILKSWLPPTMPRMRYDMIKYIERLFYDCTCEDHTITGHYRSNSNLCCKHIACVMWYLQNEDNMPKFLQRKVEAAKLSSTRNLVEKVYAYPMKKFTPYVNILLLEKFKGMNSSVGISLHRELNEPDRYKEPYAPIWVAYTEPEDVKKIIDALRDGYEIMLTERGLLKPDVEDRFADWFKKTIEDLYSKLHNILHGSEEASERKGD
jgi:hypothetical protein